MDRSNTSRYENVIIMTGVPPLGEIKLESSDNLVKTYLPAFRRFLNDHDQASDEEIPNITTYPSHTKSDIANWRFVSTAGTLRPSLNEPLHFLDATGTPKKPLVGLSSNKSIGSYDDNLSDSPYKDFYESSYVWHESINCSQGISQKDDHDLISSEENIVSRSLQNENFRLIPLSGLPTAGDVDRLVPQTVTVSLLVVTLKINFKSQIQARRTGERFDLFEILVGDDTHNKFSINIWLRSSAASSARVSGITQSSNKTHDLRSNVHMVKTGDLLLLNNIALATWKGCLYGQNLRKRIGNIETQICIIEERQLESSSSSHLTTQIAKLKKWATEYVENITNYEDDTKYKFRDYSHLPPDTQEEDKNRAIESLQYQIEL